ncbi:ATP-grasp domain-containing protein [Bacillus safensis]|uniref:ATP-grasp domain-containing protein n=1 Tax=Bacillus safensis TaxID=561879 RepID=UPI000DADC84A|nr:ATP-grasp domain-containing protein [Bacillus safensis]
MKIMFTHPYRLSLLNKSHDDHVQVLAYEDEILEEDFLASDEVFYTSPENRMSDLMSLINNLSTKPDVLVLNGAHDDECLNESNYKKLISQKGIKVIGQDLEVCELCYDKLKTKNFLINHNFPTVKQISKPEMKDFPIVIKPTNAWAGKGIKIMYNHSQLNKNIEKLDNQPYYLEPFIKGVELSVQVIKYKEKLIVCPPVYKGSTSREMIHPLKKLRIFPNPWNTDIHPKIFKLSSEIANTLNVEGVIDIDLIIADLNKIYVSEINCRLSGVSRMISHGGYNVMDMLLSIAKNKWMKYLPGQSAVVSEIPINQQFTRDDIEKLRSFEFIRYVYIRKDQKGTRQRIMVVGKSLEDIKWNLHKLTRQFYIETNILNELSSFCIE